MKLKYGLDDRPPSLEMLAYGLQWLALTIPALVIIGQVVAGVQFGNVHEQIVYLQKLCFITGVLLIAQILWGHGMPLVIGPSTVLLIGILASQGSSLDSIYSAIFLGGLVLAVLAYSGLFSLVQGLFTPRVVVVILLLIAFTMAPTIMNLVIARDSSVPLIYNILFTLLAVSLLFAAEHHIKGVWKATLVLWAILLGSIFYYLIFPSSQQGLNAVNTPYLAPFWNDFSFNLVVDPGVLLSFLLCFLALSINDLGSIQSLSSFLQADRIEKRTRRGMGLTGLGNMLSGWMGVIGPVNFSMSPGVIAATLCASRYPLLPAGMGLILISFSPWLMNYMGHIPQVIIGCILIYLMSIQIAASLVMLKEKEALLNFSSGIVIGFPLILATLIAFMPGEVVGTLPSILRPLIGNGFVMGVIMVMLLEHLLLKERA
ncbi:MAG: purine/pyrimidine permease [Syntrophomonadaceae bacterium]|jgi:xanthine/uracil permease|nr:purine/pyrimidine permease [Syntrophomonadaceae bacterium]